MPVRTTRHRPYRRRMSMTLRSLFAPDALRRTLRGAYGLDVTECVLLRSFVNDVYLVTASSSRYVLKVYQHGRWSSEEVAWELELVGHLAAAGIPVPDVIPSADGRLLGVLDAPEGPRPYALSAFVEGLKPQLPFTDGLYRDFGRVIGALHKAGDTFVTTRPGRSFDLAAILVEPLGLVLPALADRPEDQAMVRELAAEAGRRIERSAAAGLDWGACHGDVSMDNVLLTTRGLSVHDFDLSGLGWRAFDLTGVHSTPHWDAFADGYAGVRALKDEDLAVLPWFAVIGDILNLRFHLVDKPAFRGTESVGEGWAQDLLTDLRAAADGLL